MGDRVHQPLHALHRLTEGSFGGLVSRVLWARKKLLTGNFSSL